jgi:hypothetical protein
MRRTNDNSGLRLFALGAVLTMLLTACGRQEPDATPTPGVDAIFTAAFHTLEAQQATQLALTPPTQTPSPFPTLAPPSPIPTISFSTAPAGGGSGACNSAEYVADVTIPDGTTMTPGQKFVKTWRIINLGTCTWSTSYKLAFESGDAMGGATTFITVPVTPQNQTEISVNMTAPTANGTYKGNWRMQNDSSQPFGSTVFVEIKVGPGGPTATLPSPADQTATAAAGGNVTISGNAEYPDVRITYTGSGTNPSNEVFADGDGNYSFTVPSGWSGTVTPSKGAYSFTPASKAYTNVTSNQTGQNYDAQ